MPCQRNGAKAEARAAWPSAGSATPAARMERTRRRVNLACMFATMVIVMRVIDGEHLCRRFEIDDAAADLLGIGFGRGFVGERRSIRAVILHAGGNLATDDEARLVDLDP